MKMKNHYPVDVASCRSQCHQGVSKVKEVTPQTHLLWLKSRSHMGEIDFKQGTDLSLLIPCLNFFQYE